MERGRRPRNNACNPWCLFLFVPTPCWHNDVADPMELISALRFSFFQLNSCSEVWCVRLSLHPQQALRQMVLSVFGPGDDTGVLPNDVVARHGLCLDSRVTCLIDPNNIYYWILITYQQLANLSQKMHRLQHIYIYIYPYTRSTRVPTVKPYGRGTKPPKVAQRGRVLVFLQ